MCVQDRPARTLAMVWRSTPKRAASTFVGSPDSRITSTAASSSLALLLATPRRTFSGRRCAHWRPRSAMSRMLPPWSPSMRWAGLTHGGLSQVWRTSPSGRRPCAISQDARCASTMPSEAAPRPMTPYPWTCFAASHGQHSSGPRFSTFAQNRSEKVPRMPTILHRAMFQC